VKYQPYKSCSCTVCRAVKAGAWHAWCGRVRTHHGWVYEARSEDWRSEKPWKLRDTRAQNRAWKRFSHRAFRRACKHAIWLELRVGQEVSHCFYHGGEYLA
jgi:hypothetical protein